MVFLGLEVQVAGLGELLVDLVDGTAGVGALVGGDKLVLVHHIPDGGLLEVGQLTVSPHHQVVEVLIEGQGLQP